MKNKGLVITLVIAIVLILLLLFWHPIDYLKKTATEAKTDSTTVVDTSSVNKQESQQNTTKNKQQALPTTGSVSKVIVIIRDETTKKAPPPETKEQVVKTEYTAPKNTQSFTDVRTTLDPPKNKAEIIIFRFNADDGNHYPQLRFDELNDDAAAMQEFPDAVWNNTHDGHNLRLTTVDINNATGDYWITDDGIIGLKASSVQRWISNGVVDVKGSITNWAFKRMTLETINGVEYYTCRTK